jgi:hypothetical protein
MDMDMDVDVDGAAPAPNLDLSTFELRWAEALGAADSDEVADFETAGARVGHVWRKESHQCGSLMSAELTDFSDPEGMSFLDVGSNPLFLSLKKRGKYLLIRPFYESLYQQVVEKWSSDGEDRVLVLGNAGTGKSWFQPYALRRLFLGYGVALIRQVERSLYLIDLSDAQVRPIDVEMKWATPSLNLFNHKRVLYFFEPLSDRSILPLPLHLSSLTTLSPFEERIHEYQKDGLTQLMFPCWTLDHLSVAAKNDPDIPLELEEVADRFSRFGGIIRHVFAPNTQKYEENQRDRINGADLTILRATTTGIDSDPKAPGNNVSGYLLSYCNMATAGPDRFRHAVLDFTSDFVRCRIRERMKDYSIKEHIEIVVDHLNGEQTDRGADVAVDRGGVGKDGKRSASSIEKDGTATGAVAAAVAAATASKPPPKKPKRGDKPMGREIGFCDEAEEAYSSNRTPEGATTVWETWIDFMSASDAVGGQKSLGSKAVKYYRSRRNNLKAMRACITGCFDGDKEDFLSSLPTFPAYRAKKIHHCTHSS